MDNHLGDAITKRLKKIDDTSLSTIAKWTKVEADQFAHDVLGPVKCDTEEFDKLSKYILALGKTEY